MFIRPILGTLSLIDFDDYHLFEARQRFLQNQEYLISTILFRRMESERLKLVMLFLYNKFSAMNCLKTYVIRQKYVELQSCSAHRTYHASGVPNLQFIYIMLLYL